MLDLLCAHYTGYVVFYRNVGSLLEPVFEPAAKVEADHIAFKLALPDGAYDFHGVVEGDRMRGEAAHDGRVVNWTARRASAPIGQ